MATHLERINQIRADEGWFDFTMDWLFKDWLGKNPEAAASFVAYLESKQQEVREEEAREAFTNYDSEEGL